MTKKPAPKAAPTPGGDRRKKGLPAHITNPAVLAAVTAALAKRVRR